MTDDVMSDCVGGDYIIEIMPKNGEICVANFIKGMEFIEGILEFIEGTQMNI